MKRKTAQQYNADKCCFTCKYAHLVRSTPANPVLCECQVTWSEEYSQGYYHRIPMVKRHVCEYWGEDNSTKQVYQLTPNPNKDRDRFANP